MNATLDPRRGYQTSATQRRARGALRGHVNRGGSLALLLRSREPALEAVEIATLARWILFVGPVKRDRLLYELPHHYQLRMLSPEQRAVFTNRVADFERRRVGERAR